MNEKRIVLEVDDDTDPFEERTVAVLRETGILSIRHEHRSPGDDEWRSWQCMGSTIGPEGVSRLKALLNDPRPVDSPTRLNLELKNELVANPPGRRDG